MALHVDTVTEPSHYTLTSSVKRVQVVRLLLGTEGTTSP